MKKGIPILLVILTAPALARAQAGGAAPPAGAAPAEITEPSLPSNPQAPSDFQGSVATPAAAATTTGGAAGQEQVTGYDGGDLLITNTNPALYGQGEGPREVPEYHVVKKGETLWSLCQYYYTDPWAWPQLWAYNKTITNPHWIYPGDKIKMMEARKYSHLPSDNETVFHKVRPPLSDAVRLRQQAFVEERDLAKSATVMGSREEKWMLSQHDEVYVKGAERFEPTLGKLYTIYRVGPKLRNASGKHIGYLVHIVGTAKIKRLTKGKAATATIIEAYAHVERWDRVGPLRRTYKRIPLRPADKDLDGQIIANLSDTEVVGEHQIVFLDRGKNQGVQLGNRFLVVLRGDGFERLMPGEQTEDDQEEFPEETVAEISILDVRSEASMGLITRMTHEIRNGDKVRMRRGY